MLCLRWRARNAVNPLGYGDHWRSLSCARYGGLILAGMMDAAQRQQVRHFCWRPCWRINHERVSLPLTSPLDTFFTFPRGVAYPFAQTSSGGQQYWIRRVERYARCSTPRI
ncbi:hypothetical protein KCP69_03560 [Salmonella enterica subsp. enterica]|nr:hypothetical protein KCP69_03560 [Salmonella enterica subsp. enterica]